MKHGTLTQKGTQVELRFERRLAHPPEKVWRALTDSQELAHWFPARIEGARESGAELRFFFAEYAARFGLGSFPALLRNPANRVADTSLRIPGVEASVFDGADGTQLTLCHAQSDATTGEQWQEFDEYLAVLEGRYVLTINGMEIQLGAGREFVVPRGARISGRFSAGTRTLHAFSGRGLVRLPR